MKDKRIEMTRLILVLPILIFAIGLVSAWSTNTFNNSLTNETLIFTGTSNVTRYLAVPNTISALTNGMMNISGFTTSTTDECYQETANVSTACGGLSSGVYYDTGAWINPVGDAYDGNYATQTYSNTLGVFYVNYTKPSGAINATWQYKLGTLATSNVSVPDDCFNANPTTVTFRMASVNSGDDSNAFCLNSTDWHQLVFTGDTNGRDIFEEAIFWNIRNVVPVSLFIGDSNQNLSVGANGTVPITTHLSYLQSYINNYLTASYLVGSNYIIPFTFFSEIAGNITYLDLNFNNEGFTENNQTYNSSTYETSQETFTLNTTYDSSEYSITGTLYYNGTAYVGTRTGTGSNAIFTRTLTIPTVTSQQTKNFYWNISLTNSSGVISYTSTSTKTQNVSNISLSLCGGSGGTVPYINFTFKDETTDTVINASADLATWDYWLGDGTVEKTLIFTNTSVNPSYAFCFKPADKTLSDSLLFQYASAGYPQRQFYRSGTLTNTTTNQVLYLLSSANGIYSTFIIQDGFNKPLPGVTVQISRQFNGVWTLISQGTTDSAGSVTFWVNPNYDHQITATKTGYTSTTVTVRPTQSVYTLTMSSGSASNTNYTWSGISWTAYPRLGVPLVFNTSYVFGFDTTATYGNLVACKMELKNETLDVIATFTSTATNSSYCSASGAFNIGNTERIFSYMYLDLGSGYGLLKANDMWVSDYLPTPSSWNIFDSLKNFVDSGEFGTTHNRQEFSRIVAFFFVMILIIGGVSFFTNFELFQAGGALILIWAFIGMGSFLGFFNITGISSFTWFNKYTIFFVTTFITWGFVANQYRRASQ